MEIRKLVLEDIEAISAIAQEVFPANYHVTEKALRRKLFLHPCFCQEASYSLWEDEECLGFIGVKCPGYKNLFPDMAWLSILAVKKDAQRKGYGSLLLEKAEDSLKALGIKKWIVGQDFGCFFSGLPEVTEELCGFFRKNHFEVSDDDPYYDLEGNVQNNPWMENYQADHFREQWSVHTYNKEETALLAFLEQEFPGRWKYEVENALKAGKSPDEIVLLWNQDRSQIQGFCMLGKEADGRGKLGPIGIAKEARGNGVGEYFLWECLQQLKHLERDRVNIDWTILTKFYGKFGFVPERTYCGAHKVL